MKITNVYLNSLYLVILSLGSIYYFDVVVGKHSMEMFAGAMYMSIFYAVSAFIANYGLLYLLNRRYVKMFWIIVCCVIFNEIVLNIFCYFVMTGHKILFAELITCISDSNSFSGSQVVVYGSALLVLLSVVLSFATTYLLKPGAQDQQQSTLYDKEN